MFITAKEDEAKMFISGFVGGTGEAGLTADGGWWPWKGVPLLYDALCCKGKGGFWRFQGPNKKPKLPPMARVMSFPGKLLGSDILTPDQWGGQWPGSQGQRVLIVPNTQGLAQIMPLFYYKRFYHKVTSMSFCNITGSHSSTPHDTLSAQIKTISYCTHIITLTATLKPPLLLPDPV